MNEQQKQEAWEKMKALFFEMGCDVDHSQEQSARDKFFCFLDEYCDE